MLSFSAPFFDVWSGLGVTGARRLEHLKKNARRIANKILAHSVLRRGLDEEEGEEEEEDPNALAQQRGHVFSS